MEEKIENVIIVGSGPAGYTAAIYAARAGLEPLLLASSIQPGGALTTTTMVENFPGFPGGIMGPELMDNMLEQVEEHGARVEYDDAIEFNLSGEIKEITTGEGRTLKARAVILAMGAQHKTLGAPGEEELTGRGVSTCATCDGAFFAGKDVAVIGGGDSALEEALYLANVASSVTLIHRRDTLRASHAMVKKMEENEKISPMWNTTVEKINGEGAVESLSLSTNNVPGELNVSAAFVAIGHTPRSSVLNGAVVTDTEGYVRTFNSTTSTNIDGVFACGDLVDKNYRQAITAAGSGCAAALDAQRYLA